MECLLLYIWRKLLTELWGCCSPCVWFPLAAERPAFHFTAHVFTDYSRQVVPPFDRFKVQVQNIQRKLSFSTGSMFIFAIFHKHKHLQIFLEATRFEREPLQRFCWLNPFICQRFIFLKHVQERKMHSFILYSAGVYWSTQEYLYTGKYQKLQVMGTCVLLASADVNLWWFIHKDIIWNMTPCPARRYVNKVEEHVLN